MYPYSYDYAGAPAYALPIMTAPNVSLPHYYDYGTTQYFHVQQPIPTLAPVVQQSQRWNPYAKAAPAPKNRMKQAAPPPKQRKVSKQVQMKHLFVKKASGWLLGPYSKTSLPREVEKNVLDWFFRINCILKEFVTKEDSSLWVPLMIYCERYVDSQVKKKGKKSIITAITFNELIEMLIMSVIATLKFWGEDCKFDLKLLTPHTALSQTKLKDMERHFLNEISFCLFISQESLDDYERNTV